MPSKASTGRKFVKTASGAVCLASSIVLLAVPAISNAAGFTYDGVSDGDPYTRVFDVSWFNGHDQATYPSTDLSNKTTVRYGKGTDAGTPGDSTEYSWLFLEVPLYAKNMVWGDAFDPLKNPDGAAAANDLLAGYGGKALNFGDATGSEKVLFGESSLGDGKKGGSGLTMLDLYNGTINDQTPSWNVLGFKDSTDYLLGAGSGECGIANAATDCNATGRTMSFEVKLTALNGGGTDGGAGLQADLEQFGVSFHLSPDATLDPPSEIPVPAAFWLFGTALIGFIGFSRRTNLG